MTGEALQGPLTGTRLTVLTAVPKVHWRDRRAAYPQSQILTSHGVQASAEDSYTSYHASRQTGLVLPAHTNTQLPPKDLAIGIRIGEQARAYPLRMFTQTTIITDRVAGKDLSPPGNRARTRRRLLGILLRVHRGRNNLHAFILEPARSGKGRELLLTV